MPCPDQRPLRLLVVRYRFIGDTVLAIPTLRNLRHAFPQATIDVLAEPVSGDTLAHCPYKNEILFWNPRAKKNTAPKPGHLPRGTLACARVLRQRCYDRVYILRRSFSAAWLAFLARIPHRVGFATEGGNWLLHRHTPYPDKHEVECFLDVLRADDIPIDDAHNENWTDPAVDARVEAQLAAQGGARPPGALSSVDAVTPLAVRRPARRVFICAKSVFAAKDWAPDCFAALIDWLVHERACEIHFCDAPANASYYDKIRAALPRALMRPCVDWSSLLSIRDCGSLFRHIDLAVGIDTGLLHIAASFRVPVVALFGPLEPRRWHPWGTPYEILRPDDLSGPRPLLRIGVDAVRRAVDLHLHKLTSRDSTS